MLRRIGHGDLAEVFVAVRSDGEHGGATPNGEPLAVKRVWREMSRYAEIHRLLAEEGRLAVQLAHPNVVDTYELGSVGGRPYIAMEYVPGADLAHLVERCGPGTLPPGCVTRIGIDACAALSYVHAAPMADGRVLRVVHGDLTPTNIVVSTSGSAKLIDFSVATWLELPAEDAPPSSATDASPSPAPTELRQMSDSGQHASVRGSYAYMSPEQARGQAIDGRTDVFALGVVLWELFSGRRLFRRAANYLTLAAVVEEDAPTLRELGVDLGAATKALDRVLQRALAKDRDDRYDNASALAKDLQDVAARGGWDLRPWTLQTTVRGLLSEQRGGKAKDGDKAAGGDKAARPNTRS